MIERLRNFSKARNVHVVGRAASIVLTRNPADGSLGAIHLAPHDYPDGKASGVLTVEFVVAGIPCVGLNGAPISNTAKPSLSRFPPKIRLKQTVTGMRLSRTTGTKANAAGVRINGVSAGRSLREF